MAARTINKNLIMNNWLNVTGEVVFDLCPNKAVPDKTVPNCKIFPDKTISDKIVQNKYQKNCKYNLQTIYELSF